MLSRRLVPCVFVILSVVFCTVGLADQTPEEKGEEKQEARFVRLARDDHGSPVALEAAIVRYVPMDCGQTGPTVDLISAVHVAEKAYYDELNRLFEKYDAVLYELVAPEGAQVPKGGFDGGGNPSLGLAATEPATRAVGQRFTQTHRRSRGQRRRGNAAHRCVP